MKRVEARNLGLTKYDTGVPCSKGHNSPRYTNSGACCKCLQGYQKAYQQQFTTQQMAINRAIGLSELTVHIPPGTASQVEAFVQALVFQREADRKAEIASRIAATNKTLGI